MATIGTRRAGALSGALAALSLPPFGLWPLAFVALVPIGMALSRRPLQHREAVAGGLWFGAIFYGTVLHWVPPTVQGMIPLGALLGFLSIALLAATSGLQAAALHHLVARRAQAPMFALPAVWVTTEMLLAYAGSLAVPWTPLGLSLAAVPSVAGPAEWIGVRGLSLWIALVNGGLVEALLARAPRRTKVVAALTVIAALAPAVVGRVRYNSLSTERLPPVVVAHIQVLRRALLDPEVRDLQVAEALARVVSIRQSGMTEELSGVTGVPVVAIFPEAPFRETWGPGLAERMQSVAQGLGIPVLLGAHVVGNGSSGTGGLGPIHNAVMIVQPDGAAQLLHGKSRLVPGVERPGLRPGPRGEAFRIDGLTMGLAICFEAAFGRDVRRLRLEGAELLVNPTNDAWFRPALPFFGSAAHAQHRAHLILRAVETRMGAVRSSMGGELLVIDPDGHLSARQPVGAEGLVSAVPSTSRITTVYVRYGELGVLLGLALLTGLAVSVCPCGRRTATPGSGAGGS